MVSATTFFVFYTVYLTGVSSMQEAFSNTFKHANASYVSLELAFNQDHVTITITDNGVGFDVEITEQKIAKGNNFGILGMRERLQLLEGTMNIFSKKNVGTKIKMHIPIRSENKEDVINGLPGKPQT
ncbi:hypothetical protein B5S25_11275 [Paenibacillus larvae subsp. pulvifaciens]|nr:hypothetical protein B5S25_11275 [Paenibacillus larvae subsp. pulvifaciens]